ncbi:MAG: M56 family metallopeptidase [Actinomycetota bacterium]
MFIVDVLLQYILPVVYDSFITLILVVAFLAVLRIRDPSMRILFLFLPLVKPFLVIAERMEMKGLSSDIPFMIGGLRLPDPHKFFTHLESTNWISSNLNQRIMLIAVAAIGLILLLRWVHLYCFYRELAYEEKVGREDVPHIYSIIDRYGEKMEIRKLEVSLTHGSYISPFVVGIRKITLVLSPALIDYLNEGERETIIAHELSHIRRHDNLIGWIALILRDMLFLNPFAHIAYVMIKGEQEKGSDKLVLKYSGKDSKQVARETLNSIKKMKTALQEKALQAPAGGYLFSPGIMWNMSRLRNRVHSIIKTNPNKIYAGVFTRVVLLVVWAIALMLQMLIIINFNGRTIFLR